MSAVSPNGDVPESPRTATSTEPAAVERTIAEVDKAHEARNIYVERIDCRCGTTIHGGDFGSIHEAYRHHRSQAVVAAIRAMSPQQQAQLIGGKVLNPYGKHERVLGPWREVRDV